MAAKKEEWLKENADGSITVTLSRGLEVNGAKLMELTMREPDVDDQIIGTQARGGETEKDAALFSNLCSIPPADLRRLKLRDWMRMQAAFQNFID